jgi:hypothetical protein
VRTPTGRFAIIDALYYVGEHVEALIRYEDGDTTRLRVCHLRGLP